MHAPPRFPQIRCSLPSFDFYDASEVAALVDSARDDERILILLAGHTGARAGELLALEWTDVDFRQKLVTFRRSRTGGITTDTKSRRPRQVPMSETLADALQAHRHLRGPLVFCQEDGAHLTLWFLHGALERAARRAQLRLLRWHDLRHSFASNLTIGGTPLRQVQEWMGHSSITMTMRYAHLAPTEQARKYLDALEAPSLEATRSAPRNTSPRQVIPPARAARRGNPRGNAVARSPIQPETSRSKASPAGVESETPVLTTRTHVDSRTDERPRVDVSVRPVVDVGPSEVPSEAMRSGKPASVEEILAEALMSAAAAGRWDIVAQLGRELEARRLAAASIPSLHEPHEPRDKTAG